MPSSHLQRWLVRLGALQHRRPYLVLLCALISLVPALALARRLELRTAFGELLPDSRPSVIEARRVAERVAGTSTLTVVGKSDDTALLRRFVDETAPALRAFPPELVSAVDDGPRAASGFLREHKVLYANLADLESLRDDLVARYDWEVSKQAGLDLELDDDDPPPPITAASIEARFRGDGKEAAKTEPGTDGYYIGENGHLAVLLVRTPLGSGDAGAAQLRQRIVELVRAANYTAQDPKFELLFTGNLVTQAEQHDAVKNDLIEVGAFGVLLVLGVVYFYFLRLRTLLAMGVTLAVGLGWAFGAARVSVGYLNTATGFLVSIIAGNGINFGIVYMARYLEERRAGAAADRAIATAHGDTCISTLGAAGAAMVAYGSLSLTDFRGFRHFGVIAGAGMMLCWVATYTVLPAVLAISERWWPLAPGSGLAEKLRGSYGRPFAWATRSAPRALALLGALSGLACLVPAVAWVRGDPMEYDLARIRNERLGETSAGALSVRVDRIVGRLGQDGRAIVVDRLDQVAPLVAELEKRRLEHADRPPFSKVVDIFSLLPKDQTQKLEVLAEMRDRLERAHRRKLLPEADWTWVETNLPAGLRAIGIDDLPEIVARPFTERDGSRGKIVYIVPSEGRSVYDAHYLKEWADSFREVRLPNGDIIRGSGDPVIFSDMLESVAHEAPKAIVASLFGTLVVIAITLGLGRRTLLATGVLLLGMTWLAGFLALSHTHLNFLNFVALPVSIGVGADYALNILGRHEIEGGKNLDRIVIETGGAVIVCSLTTMLGDLALLTSVNRAVQSYGLAAAVGEMATVFAGMLVLPAWLRWRFAKRPDAAPAT